MRPSIGDGLALNLPRLLETRMLVQANSGGGKSWLIRRVLEQTAGRVQQLVLDPEGEFQTLREKFDYVIAAPHDGDAVAHPRTAALLARKLLETRVSAILDIYDLKAHERQSFVRQFLEAVVNAPKALWQPTLIVLDEAHVFCPEKGQSEAAGAVIDLATRGRKRGFALIAATQRLAKLHKDTAAELLNKLIGRTGLDVDVKRAADELGMTPKDAMESLRPLAPGEFFAFGPALSTSVTKVKVGVVQTTHPKAGSRLLRAPPKPTAAIVAVLPRLADLPKEAEREAKTADDLRRENAGLRRELSAAKRAAPQPKADPAAARRTAATIARLTRALTDAEKFMRQGAAVAQRLADARKENPPPPAPAPAPRIAAQPAPRPERAAMNGHMPPGERAVLEACIQYPDGLDRARLTVLTGYKRSSRDAYIARLATKGYVQTLANAVTATDEGRDALPDAAPLPTGDQLREFWRARLPEGERKLLDVLVAAYPEAVPRSSLDEETGYRRSSRDAYLSRLAAKQLVTEPERGMVRATEVLFQ